MNYIILGLGFGDEGKGLITDYICSKLSPKTDIDVRFSGGHQAGHTVVVGEKRHIFSNFGAGTFRNIPTYWSKFCTVDPVGFIKEYGVLKSMGVTPVIYIDALCPITTPFDKEQNLLDKQYRQNGSCCVGFGPTIQREEDHYHLQFIDLFYPDIFREKLANILKYYKVTWGKSILSFVGCCAKIIKKAKLVYSLPNCQTYVYEGSQGLMLDKEYGFFPNVTRANIGTKNIKDIMAENNVGITKEEKFVFVTRAYCTRHGNGFMPNELTPHNITKNPNESNVTNFQGEFRRSLLDVSLLEYAINREQTYNATKILAITCLDHVVNEHRFTYKGEIVACVNMGEFIRKICAILKINSVLLSKNEDSAYVLEMDNIK